MALIEGCRHELEITIPAEAVAAETGKAVEKVQRKAHLPGFRPGKAPASLIRQRFRSDIRQEVIESLVPKALESEAEKNNLRIVGGVEYKDVHFHDGEAIHFKAQFEVAPEIELKDVRGLLVEYAEPEVSDADVSQRIDQIRDSKAEFVNLDPHPAEVGDHALVEMVSIAGLEGPPMKQDEINIEIGGADTFQQLTDALLGAQPGDAREATIAYPENYAAQNLAGKTVTFRLTVKALRKRELPDLDDEFAKDLGDFQTLDELREEIRKAIFREREAAAQMTAKNALIDKLVDMHDFPVPESFVDRQIETNLEGQLRMLQQQGMDVSKLQLDWNVVKEKQRDRGIHDVKASLLLDRIATRESVEVLSDEIDREVQRIARQEREPVAATRMRLEKDGTLGRIYNRIRTEKTLNFLFEHARKEAPAATPATPETAG